MSKSYARLMKASLALLVPVFVFYTYPTIFGPVKVYYKNITESLVFSLVLSFYILGCILEPNQFVNKLGNSGFFKFWNKLSYTHFMTHYFLLYAIDHYWGILFRTFPCNFLGYIFNTMLLVIVPIPLSLLVIKYIEQPAIELEARFLKSYNRWTQQVTQKEV